MTHQSIGGQRVRGSGERGNKRVGHLSPRSLIGCCRLQGRHVRSHLLKLAVNRMAAISGTLVLRCNGISSFWNKRRQFFMAFDAPRRSVGELVRCGFILKWFAWIESQESSFLMTSGTMHIIRVSLISTWNLTFYLLTELHCGRTCGWSPFLSALL